MNSVWMLGSWSGRVQETELITQNKEDIVMCMGNGAKAVSIIIGI